MVPREFPRWREAFGLMGLPNGALSTPSKSLKWPVETGSRSEGETRETYGLLVDKVF
jgi:hypothetical protein